MPNSSSKFFTALFGFVMTNAMGVTPPKTDIVTMSNTTIVGMTYICPVVRSKTGDGCVRLQAKQVVLTATSSSTGQVVSKYNYPLRDADTHMELEAAPGRWLVRATGPVHAVTCTNGIGTCGTTNACDVGQSYRPGNLYYAEFTNLAPDLKNNAQIQSVNIYCYADR